ncbi:MAG: glycosyltransferase family 4 protein, partial [Myxococcaceae bacterium]|nr:glycosyltransferase family 4 protein [Myxococcaceae bacterium]
MNAAAGGAALSTLGLMRALEQQGIASSAVCFPNGDAAERQALLDATHGRAEFVELYTWHRKIRSAAWKRPLLELRQWVRTRGRVRSLGAVALAARRTRAQLVHTNTILTPEGGQAARALGLPHVWHLRELIGPGDPFQLPLRGPALGRYLRRHASVVIANSGASARNLAGLLDADRLATIPNGLELAPFLALGPKVGGPLVVGMVASVTSRTKKHALFLEAARRLRGQAEFRIYGHLPAEGDDPYADEVRRLAQQAGVQLCGFLSAEAIAPQLDLLVHPADNESFGRTVVEAMAAGRPVVGANGGGVAELVEAGVTGWLAPPDDAEALARAIAEALQDPARRATFGAAGRERARA